MINPIRLKGKPANISRYYTIGDYYTKGSDEHSQWGGHIAAEFGLEGPVDSATFKELLAGRVGEVQLGRRRLEGGLQHHPGWDFAVNAPKSVSIMALVGRDDRILAAHEKSVGVALDYLEEHATLRRREDGKILHETTGRLIYARFTEHASRELDPHLHTHVVVLNLTDRRDGDQIVSLETRAMFVEQIVAGQVYRNELAHQLRSLGYEIEYDPRKGLFEIRDVPAALVKDMSQRAEQISAHADAHGLTGQAGRQQSFYATRGPKEKTSLDQLHDQWASRASIYRDALIGVREEADRNDGMAGVPAPGTSARAMLFGIRQAETREAVNNLGRMLRLALASHVGEVRLADIRPLAEEHEGRHKLLATTHQTGDDIHTRGRTTRRTARLELALSDHLALALDDTAPIATPERLRAVMADAGLNPAQETALLHIGATNDRIVGVHGVAGAGKSTLIKALKDAASPDISFIALAPTSSAAASLGGMAGIESRTVASLVAGGGRNIDDSHVLVLDEAGQLGNRQALRVLEISRLTGARLILLGDNKQTGAIEQGKAFWLLQKLGLPTAQLTESVRQETRMMKAAVTQARLGNYAASIENLDKIVSGADAETLANGLVSEWTRLKPANRVSTNILVLENATRLIVNSKIREVLKTEGAVAAEEARLSVLTPTGMTTEEKHMARFYSGGQVVIFSRDNAGLGIARDTEYRVLGLARDSRGRQRVRLVDEHGRTISWDPRLGRASQVNVFQNDHRALAAGDRLQWRLVNHDLQIRNADRGTVQALDGTIATIRWDRGGRVQQIDLGEHKTWDHGYAETVYSAQSKTYDRVYVLAPVGSPLVTGQNYYTAITRARFGVKLWTQDVDRLVDRLTSHSGEKTSSLEGLGRLDSSSIAGRNQRHGERWDRLRDAQRVERANRKARVQADREADKTSGGLADFLARQAQASAAAMDRWLSSLVKSERALALREGDTRTSGTEPGQAAPMQQPTQCAGHER